MSERIKFCTTRAAFRRHTAEIVDLVRAAFESTSVSPKLHILACDAADWLDRFGSLGLFAEQGQEAWHGYFKQFAIVYAAGSFLESIVRLVQRSAVSRGTGGAAFNRGKRRASAASNARCAKRPGDLRIARDREAAGLEARQSAVCMASAIANTAKWSVSAHLAAVTKISADRDWPA